MNSPRRCLSLIVFPVIILSGCITNLKNSYRSLSKADKLLVVPYDPSIATTDTSFKLYEIDAAKIKSEMKEDRYYVVLTWVPECPGANCRTLAYYNRLNKQLASLGVKSYLVAPRFQMKETKRQYNKFGYGDKLYVMDKAVYHNKVGSSKPFIEDLVGHKVSNKDTLSWASFMVFENQQLLGYGQTRERIFDLIK